MKQTIYTVVHCESCYNRDGIFTGQVDSVLTETGHQHAIELAKKLKKAEISIAYRSSLTRTKQTLEHILAYHPETKVVIDDRIIERDYGELSKLKKQNIKNLILNFIHFIIVLMMYHHLVVKVFSKLKKEFYLSLKSY